ncbi:hypothetical protein CUMW_152140 [Citrus unshiu]|nr:hypothetical protein CUMW_152140 [Citrus unshiu]
MVCLLSKNSSVSVVFDKPVFPSLSICVYIICILTSMQMFGSEAVKQLNYVECFPDGYRKGTKIAKACSDAKIEGFPTWVINGQVLSGEQDLSDLAKASGFPEMSQPS